MFFFNLSKILYYREEISREVFDNEVYRHLPSFLSIKSQLYRIRKSVIPSLPSSLDTLKIDGVWQKTTDGRQFVLADNGSGVDRIIVSKIIHST